MGAQHTPGPWAIGHDCNDGDTAGLATVVDAKGHRVASAAVRFNRAIPMGRDETLLQYTARASEAGERYANARVIAEAPAMLGALAECADAMSACAEIMEQTDLDRIAAMLRTRHDDVIALLKRATGAAK